MQGDSEGECGDLGAIENAGLVHVIPDVEVVGGALIAVQGKLGRPVISHLGVEEVQVGGRTFNTTALYPSLLTTLRPITWPTPPVEVIAVPVFDVQVLVLGFLVDLGTTNDAC